MNYNNHLNIIEFSLFSYSLLYSLVFLYLFLNYIRMIVFNFLYSLFANSLYFIITLSNHHIIKLIMAFRFALLASGLRSQVRSRRRLCHYILSKGESCSTSRRLCVPSASPLTQTHQYIIYSTLSNRLFSLPNRFISIPDRFIPIP